MYETLTQLLTDPINAVIVTGFLTIIVGGICFALAIYFDDGS